MEEKKYPKIKIDVTDFPYTEICERQYWTHQQLADLYNLGTPPYPDKIETLYMCCEPFVDALPPDL